MMNPADHPQLTALQRPAESPTLWLSLALGSVLIHLVLFILASIVSTQTARVQVNLEPIAVEFVEPARSAAAGRAIAVNPGKPSPRKPSDTQAQNRLARSPAFSQPAEPPFVPFPPVKRRLSARPQAQQPKPVTKPIQPQATATRPSQTQQPNLPNQTQGRSELDGNPSQESVPGDASNAGNGAPGATESQSPVQSGNPIGQPPEGRSVKVALSNPHQSGADALKQAAQLIDSEKTVLVSYPAALANQTIRLEVSLDIEKNGLVVDVKKTTLLSPESALKQDTVDDMARQIFIASQWRFEPAQDDPGGLSVMLRRSNLIIEAQVRLP